MAKGSFQQEVERRIQELVPASMREDWSVGAEVASQAHVDVSVVYRVAFGCSISELRAGPLPDEARRLASEADLRATLNALHASKQRELNARLERWVLDKAEACDALLEAKACLGTAPSQGYQLTCVSCDGDKQLRCLACFGAGKLACSDCHGEKGKPCPQCVDKETPGCPRCNKGRVACWRCAATGHVRCADCEASGRVKCGACAGTGTRHVVGTVVCHVSRAFSMSVRAAPEDAPAWLREASDLDALQVIGDFVRGKWSHQSGRLHIPYDGVIELRRCEVRVREQTYSAWAYGRERHVEDFAYVAQRLLDASSNELRGALAEEEDVKRCAQTIRTFFASRLHTNAGRRDELPARKAVDLALRDRLVSPEYVDQAHALAQRATRLVERKARVGVSPWLVLPVLFACVLQAAPFHRFAAVVLAGGLAWLTYAFLEHRAGTSTVAAWGTRLPRSWHRKRALARRLAWASGMLAIAIAGVPSTLLLRMLEQLGGPDRLSGIYAHGDERLVVFPERGGRFVLRHVNAVAGAGYCEQRAVVKRGIWEDYELVDGPSVGTAYMRSLGLALVLLPDDSRQCGDVRAPMRFERRMTALTCTVIGDRARLSTINGTPRNYVERGTVVQVLPWQADLRRVLVRGEEVGTLRTRDVDCAPESLQALRDVLFGAYQGDEPRARR